MVYKQMDKASLGIAGSPVHQEETFLGGILAAGDLVCLVRVCIVFLQSLPEFDQGSPKGDDRPLEKARIGESRIME